MCVPQNSFTNFTLRSMFTAISRFTEVVYGEVCHLAAGERNATQNIKTSVSTAESECDDGLQKEEHI